MKAARVKSRLRKTASDTRKKILKGMASSDMSALRRLNPLRNATSYAGRLIKSVFENIQAILIKFIPNADCKIHEMKKEVWADLSAVYYKYEDMLQKKAFREVIYEISEIISNDKWNKIYGKLYRMKRTQFF